MGSNLGGKIENFSYPILFTHVVIWVSAAQNWKETFNSDIWKWSYEQIKIPVWQIILISVLVWLKNLDISIGIGMSMYHYVWICMPMYDYICLYMTMYDY